MNLVRIQVTSLAAVLVAIGASVAHGTPAMASDAPIAATGITPTATAAQGGNPFDSSASVKVTAVGRGKHASPGADFPLAVTLVIERGWHIWTNERPLPPDLSAFDGGIATTIAIVGTTSGINPNLEFAQWPDIHRVEADLGEGKRPYGVFEGTQHIYLPATIEPSATGTARVTLAVTFQACDDDECKAPATVEVTIEIPIVAGAPLGDAPVAFAPFDNSVYARIHAGDAADTNVPFDVLGWSFHIDASGIGLVLLMAVAAVGGALLNFTPCVLPVIPIKIMGLAAAAGNRSRCFQLGLAMCLGVIAFWLVLGTLIATVAGFDTANALFQYRPFPIAVGVFIAVMAIGMAGFFSVQLPNWVYAIEPKHDSAGGSFVFGVMTAVLSTPCTAPFMGSAAGWAATSGSTTTVLFIFGAIGFGMAAPYLVLAAYPSLVERMPRTGPSSELVKQVMGLLLLAGAIYFIGSGVNGYLEEPAMAYWWLIAAVGAAAGCWLTWRTLRIAKSATFRAGFAALGVFIALLSGVIGFAATYEPVHWQTWTAETEAEALQAHEVLVIDFTAEWCGNCKFLEATVLHSDAVAERLNAPGVTALKVDLTKGLPERSARLASTGRITIPLLLIIGRDGTEVLKSEAYTPSQVIAAMDRAMSAK